MAKKELAVGDSTFVELIFSTGHYSKRTSKSARILCNSATNPPRLTISAHPLKYVDSLALFSIVPHMLNLDENRPDEQPKAWEYRLVITNRSEEKFKLSLVAAPAMEGIEVDIPGGDIKPGKHKTIKVKIDPMLAEDLFAKSFTFEASDSANTRFTIPIEKKMRWGPAPTSSR